MSGTNPTAFPGVGIPPLITTSTVSTAPTGSSTSGSSSNPSPGPSGPASSLYLFTFLAVLILLLIVSVAVIIRSLILRQRFRRSIEEALAAGIIFDYPPGHRPGRFKKDLGAKPVLSDAWIESGFYSTWNDMQPVSVKVLTKSSTTQPMDSHEAYLNTPTGRLHAILAEARYMSSPRMPPQSRTPRAQTEAQAPSTPTPPASAVPLIDVEDPAGISPSKSTDLTIQVSVLLAMPDASRPQWNPRFAQDSPYSDSETTSKTPNYTAFGASEHDDEELPHLVFGVAEVPCKAPISTPSSSPNPQRSQSDRTS